MPAIFKYDVNYSGGGSGATDTTLTKSGTPADAKTVGDAIARLEAMFNSINMQYLNSEGVDVVQLKDVEGVWHDWASGGLNDKALIPTMTTNTSPYGIASGYKINTSNTEYKAFDGDTQTICTSTATGTSPYPYVEYTFDKEVKMCKVELWLGHQTVQTSKFMNILVLIDDVWTNIKSTSIAIPVGNTPTSFIYDFTPQNIKGIRVELQDGTSSRSQFYGVQVYGKEVV